MKQRYYNIFIFQVTVWFIAYHLFALFRILTVPDPYEMPLLRTESSLINYILINSIAALLLASFLSLVDIFMLSHVKENHSFGYYIIRKTVSYIVSIFVVLVIVITISTTTMHISFQEVSGTYLPRIYIGYIMFSLLISILIGFLSQINDKFVPGRFLPRYLGIEQGKVHLILECQAQQYTPVDCARLF